MSVRQWVGRPSQAAYSTPELYAHTIPALVHIFAVPSGDKTTLFAGTGFFVSADGYIMTAAHVVCEDPGNRICKRLFVRVRSGEYYTVVPVKIDLEHDVALLRVVRGVQLVDKEKGIARMKFVDGELSSRRFEYLEIGESRIMGPGERVVVVGIPGKYGTLVAEGILSCSRSQVISMKMEDATYRDVVLMGVMIFPGNSGGPVLNTRGEVVGIATVGTDRPISFFQRIEYAAALLSDSTARVVTRRGLNYDKKYADDDDE